MASREDRQFKYHRLPRSSFQALRITAALESPVAGDFSLPFDAILYYISHREVLGAQGVTVPGASGNAGSSGASMPLARCEEHGPHWYYAASFVQWGAHADGVDHWNSRVDVSLAYLVDFQGRRGKIDISSSAYKAYHQPIFYRHAGVLTWYALGEPREIRRLLRFATHLGKKTSQGWGAIGKWEVEPWDHDWSVRGPRGEAMRAIPQTGGLLAGYRPPYWHPRNQMPCSVVADSAA